MAVGEQLDQERARLRAIAFVLNGEACLVAKDEYAWTPSLDLAREAMRAKALIDAPEIIDFAKAVQLEAAHQRARWGSDHDAGKADADWFWLIGYLGGKALRADDGVEKQLHRIITVAAAACNWHAAKLGQTDIRPGIEPPKGLGPDDFGINSKVPVLR